MASPGPYSNVQSEPNDPGFFYTEYFLWRRLSGFRDFALASPAGELASKLLAAEEVRYFYDGLFVKERAPSSPVSGTRTNPITR